jgi:hypothetical protein
MKRVTLFLAALLFSKVAFTQKVSTVFFDLNYDTTESIATVHENVPNHVFGEIAGAGEPETLTSPWGLSMNYKIENCTYKKK